MKQLGINTQISGSISGSKTESLIQQKPNLEKDKKSGSDFSALLRETIDNVNEEQKISDSKAKELATGKGDNIHETMLAVSQAELSFNLMVQVRNKALEAYQEIMRMPV